MSFSTAAGCQQYSDEELAAIVDEAHRNGLRTAAHATATPASAPASGPGSTASSTGRWPPRTRSKQMVEHDTFLVGTTALADHMAVDRIHPILQKKAAEIFPQARRMFGRALELGVTKSGSRPAQRAIAP